MAFRLARANLLAAQSRQKEYADFKRQNFAFQVGDEVLLSTVNLQLRVAASNARKLLPKYIGPFKNLARVNEVAYPLQLPDKMKVHPVFHIILLRAFRSDGSYIPHPPTCFEDHHLEYTVECILNHRDKPYRGKTRRECLVKWQGYGPEHNTWEPEAHCGNSSELISAYWSYRAKSGLILQSPPLVTSSVDTPAVVPQLDSNAIVPDTPSLNPPDTTPSVPDKFATFWKS